MEMGEILAKRNRQEAQDPSLDLIQEADEESEDSFERIERENLRKKRLERYDDKLEVYEQQLIKT